MDPETPLHTTVDKDALFRAGFQAASEALMFVEDGHCRLANAAAAALLGTGSVEGADIVKALPGAEGVVVGDERHVAVHHGKGKIIVERVGQTWFDRPRLLRLRRRSAGGEVERLAQVNDFKTQLLNTAAHELNTPITPIRLQLHLLTSGTLGTLGERQAKAISVLDRNVQRLSDLVSDILDVARLESGRLPVDPKPVPLSHLIREAVDSYAETARAVRINMVVDIKEDASVLADDRRVNQVLHNLMSNAIKFTPEGGTVTVRSRIDDHGLVEIADSGIGMDADQLSRLFQPFTRVHDEKAITAPGTGLGLYICKGIVESHGGRIFADSLGPGKGTVFRIALPLATGTVPASRPEVIEESSIAMRLRELI